MSCKGNWRCIYILYTKRWPHCFETRYVNTLCHNTLVLVSILNCKQRQVHHCAICNGRPNWAVTHIRRRTDLIPFTTLRIMHSLPNKEQITRVRFSKNRLLTFPLRQRISSVTFKRFWLIFNRHTILYTNYFQDKICFCWLLFRNGSTIWKQM